MKQPAPRLRMFAGPNGSGKSTLKSNLKPDWLGTYLNPDDIEKALRSNAGTLELRDYGVGATTEQVRAYFRQSALLEQQGLLERIDTVTVQGSLLSLGALDIDSYVAAVLVSFLRASLIKKGETVSFETVMSGPDKVDFFCATRRQGYRTYLYYVATEDPLINIERIKQRVQQGGHSVDPEKVVARYHRSLGKLWDAIQCSDRAYIWDNSGATLELLAEFNDGELDLKVSNVPLWFEQAVLAKLGEDADETD